MPRDKAVGSAPKQKSTTAKLKKSNSDVVPVVPNWPSLQPLVPTEDLSMEVLLKDQIIIIRNLLTSTLCKNYVSFLSSLPLITTPTKPKEGDAVRINDRFEVHDPAFAEQLWSSTALKHLVTGTTRNDEDEETDGLPRDLEKLWGGQSCGLNPRIRIYRYRKDQFFGQHYDTSTTLTLPHPTTTAPPTRAQTTWTLLIYLTSPTTGCLGGETVFYPEPEPPPPSQRHHKREQEKENESKAVITVGLETGMALLHRHGDECVLHEGRPVVEGEKWVIRSDLCVVR